jgi:hypothetical protein
MGRSTVRGAGVRAIVTTLSTLFSNVKNRNWSFKCFVVLFVGTHVAYVVLQHFLVCRRQVSERPSALLQRDRVVRLVTHNTSLCSLNVLQEGSESKQAQRKSSSSSSSRSRSSMLGSSSGGVLRRPAGCKHNQSPWKCKSSPRILRPAAAVGFSGKAAAQKRKRQQQRQRKQRGEHSTCLQVPASTNKLMFCDGAAQHQYNRTTQLHLTPGCNVR